jgi:hypothetical protein
VARVHLLRRERVSMCRMTRVKIEDQHPSVMTQWGQWLDMSTFCVV